VTVISDICYAFVTLCNFVTVIFLAKPKTEKNKTKLKIGKIRREKREKETSKSTLANSDKVS